MIGEAARPSLGGADPPSGLDAAELPLRLSALAGAVGVNTILRIAPGAGELGAALEMLGRRALVIDPHASQLSALPEGQLLALRPAAKDGWLTTSAGLLESVARPALGALLHALNRVSHRHLHVEITSAPAGPHNRRHRSVLPVTTWMALFAAAGFADARIRHPGLHDAGPAEILDDPLGAHWQALNPLRMEQPFLRSGLLLEKVRDLPPREEFLVGWRSRFGWLCDSPWVPKGPLPDPGPIAVALMHMQDFQTLYPVAAGLPRGRVHFITRFGRHEANPLNIRTIESFLLSRGHQVIADLSAREAVAALPGDAVLLSASESTGDALHILTSGLVAAARARGLGTAQLQHGIMVPDGQWQPYLMASEHLFAWSDSHAEALRACGCSTLPPVSVIGCPKYDLVGNAVPWEAVLGSWVEAWPRRCLVAANTSWHAHGVRTGEMDSALLRIAQRHPDWLFLFKTHPSYPEHFLLRDALPANVAVITDPALLVLDCPFQSLLSGADALIATLSTSLLDAAAADLPAVAVDTAHPSRYRHLTLLRAEDVRLPQGAAINDAFRRHHLADGTLGTASASLLRALPGLREAAAPSPAHEGWAAIAHRYGDLLRTGEVEAPKSNAPPRIGLRFPFGRDGEPEPLWQADASVRLRNGNRWCRAHHDGLSLHPNAGRDRPVMLQYEGIRLADEQLLVAQVRTGPRCPKVELSIALASGGERIGSWSYQLGAADHFRLSIPIPPARTITLTLAVVLAPESSSANGAGVRFHDLDLVRPRPAG